MLERILTPDVEEVQVRAQMVVDARGSHEVQDLSDTTRGEGGFGSTGK